MNRTRYIPSIVMLLAAFVACITTIYFEYSTKEVLFIVLGTSVVFFVIGLFIKMFIEKYLVISTMSEVIEETEEKEEKEEIDNDNENESVNNIEK